MAIEDYVNIDDRIDKEAIGLFVERCSFPNIYDYTTIIRLELTKRDRWLLEKYQKLDRVCAFIYMGLYSGFRQFRKHSSEAFPFFIEKGIKTLEEYIDLIKKGEVSAINHYNEMARIIRFTRQSERKKNYN